MVDLVGNEISLTRQIAQPVILERKVPVGEVIIGKVDPRTLSREQFGQSPELLFHGGRSMTFNRQFPVTNVWSATVGLGYYTVSDRSVAEEYSRKRLSESGRSSQTPCVVEVLPHQARMYDFRTSDGNENASIPHEFYTKYRAYIEAELAKRYPSASSLSGKEAFDRASLQEYWLMLLRLGREIKEGVPTKMRSLLSVTGKASESEFGAELFRDFMLQEGYEGAIYLEGREGKVEADCPSYIFYSLDKTGDFDTWHPDSN